MCDATFDPDVDVVIDTAIRDHPERFLPNLLWWLRNLAGVSRDRAPRASYLLPRPLEVQEEVAALVATAAPLQADTTKEEFDDKSVLKQWVAQNLRPVADGTAAPSVLLPKRPTDTSK